MTQKAFFIGWFSLVISCSAQQTSNTTQIIETKTEKTVLQQNDLNSTKYAKDWDAFKLAIVQKDKEKTAALCTTNIHDFDGLFSLLNDAFVRQIMEQTMYSQLTEEMLDKQSYMQFYAENIGIDQFGYEYASAVTLYFIKTSEGLRLDKYSAAG